MKTLFALCAALTFLQVLDVSIASAIPKESLEKEDVAKIVSENPEKVVTVGQTENKMKTEENLVREAKLTNEEDLKNNVNVEAESKPLEVTNEPASNMVTKQITPEEEQRHETQSNIEELSANQEALAKTVERPRVL